MMRVMPSGARRWAAAMALASGGITALAEGPSLVRLKYAVFDPLAGEPIVPRQLEIDAPGVYLVQFVGTPLEEMRAAVRRAGGRVGVFMTDDTHIVRMDADAAERVRRLACVRWVGAYRAAYRLSDGARADLLLGADAPVRYSIWLWERGAAMQANMCAAIRDIGGIVDSSSPLGFRVEATLNHEQLERIVAMPEVLYIDERGPSGGDMTLPRLLSGAHPYLSGLGITGQGVRGEDADNGVLDTHVAFQAHLVLYYGPPGVSDFHGTCTYGILFGDGTGNANGTGMLPSGQGIFLSYFQLADFGGNLSRYAAIADLLNPSLPYQGVFQLSAWGGALTTQYTTVSAELDDLIFSSDIIIAQSQSNTGSQLSRPQAWSKNVVSVGGLDARATPDRLDDQWDGGSFGPAADGRIKPELIQSDADAITATYFCDTCYGGFGGTSSSASIIAGCSGLVMQMWHVGTFAGFGGGSSVFADRPHAATTRALMISSAYQYDWTAGGPNASLPRGRQGWGMPDLQAMSLVAPRTFIVNQTDAILPSQTRTYPISVAAGEPALRVVMVYADPAGNPAAAQARINDVSLRVTGPGGSPVYWGNAGLMSGIWSTPGGSADTANTVECVFIQAPAPGAWVVEVIGTQIVQDSRLSTPELDADFALVVAGGVPPAPCYANCDNSSIAPILNANDFVCFLSSFAAATSYANCDGSSIEPILNANDFVCFLTRFAAGCP